MELTSLPILYYSLAVKYPDLIHILMIHDFIPILYIMKYDMCTIGQSIEYQINSLLLKTQADLV